MVFILGLPPDSRCKFFNPDPPVKKKDLQASTGYGHYGVVISLGALFPAHHITTDSFTDDIPAIGVTGGVSLQFGVPSSLLYRAIVVSVEEA